MTRSGRFEPEPPGSGSNAYELVGGSHKEGGALPAKGTVRGGTVEPDRTQMLAGGRQHEHTSGPSGKEIAVAVNDQAVGKAWTPVNQGGGIEEDSTASNPAGVSDLVSHPDGPIRVGVGDVERSFIG